MEFLLFTTAVVITFWIAYSALFVLVPMFFTGLPVRPTMAVFYSLLLIASLNILFGAIQLLIPEPFWANRFQHTMGGVVAFVMFFLVVRVTALGVANELLEFFLQQTTGIIFNDDIFDTWLDLFSNTNGALLAGGLLTMLIPRNKAEKLPDDNPASKYYYMQ